MEKSRRIDLHSHSTYSDGTLTPFELIDLAYQNKVSVMSIADHDTIDAYTEELFSYAKSKNIEIIPAVEMSTKYFGVGIHVLGYNFNLDNQELIKCLSMLKNARLDYLMNVAKALNNLGYTIDTTKLKKLPTVTKAHIALDVVEREENKDLLIKNFNHIPSKGEFIETIMNEGCPAFVEKFSITPIDASRIIHNAGGKVVLAHPVAYAHEDNITPEQISTLIKDMKADGVESNYLYVDRNNILYDETKFWGKLAEKNNVFSTIGSDFHNFDPLRPELGFVNTNFSLKEQEITKILNNLRK